MRDRLAKESPEERETRLRQMRLRSHLKRDSRLRQMSTRQRERLATESITQHKHKTGAISIAAAVRELRLAPNYALHVTSYLVPIYTVYVPPDCPAESNSKRKHARSRGAHDRMRWIAHHLCITNCEETLRLA